MSKNKIKKILREHSPNHGGSSKNLNFKIPKPLWMKLSVKASHSNKFVNQYVIDLIMRDTEGIEVKIT